MIYLAAPYSHPDDEVREYRVRICANIAGVMMARGEQLYAPTVHGHALWRAARSCGHDLPADAEFWRSINDPIQRICSSLVVLKIEGWATSFGVAHEVRLAEKISQPITYLSVHIVAEPADAQDH